MAENTGLASSAKNAGDDLTAVIYNHLVTDVKKLRQEGFNAGAIINGATLPVPVYQNTTDNEVYACDADDTDKLNFIGFAITNAVDAGAIIVQHTGIVGGFTGLDEGEKYYVQDAVGTIGKTPGTNSILVGYAISATEIIIDKFNGKDISTFFMEASANLKLSADTERTTTNNTYTKLKEIAMLYAGVVTVKFSLKDAVNGDGWASFGRIYKNGVATGTERQQDTGGWVEYSEDITVNVGDKLQLYAKNNGGSVVVSVKEFRMYFDKTLITENGTVITN